jgi:hypothetical protein
VAYGLSDLKFKSFISILKSVSAVIPINRNTNVLITSHSKVVTVSFIVDCQIKLQSMKAPLF